MKSGIKAFFAILLIISTVFVASACDGSNLKTLNVGFFPNLTHPQALYIKDNADIKSTLGDDVDIKWYKFNAGPTEMESFRAGRLDIGYIGPIPAATGFVGTSENIRIIAGVTDAGSILVARKNLDISSVSDLAGKTVAVPQFGNTQDILLRMVLADAGLKATEDGGNVTVIQQDNSNMQSLMEKGQIEAALVPEPWGSRLVTSGTAEVILDYNEIENGDYPVAVLIVRKDFLDENRETVKAFLKAHVLATNEINGNTDKAKEKINSELDKLTGVALEEPLFSESFGRLNVSYDINKASFEKLSMAATALNVIDREVKAEDIIDLSVLEEVLSETGK